MPPEIPDHLKPPAPGPLPNDQVITGAELGDDDLQQWLTSIGDGAEIELPSLSLGTPTPTPTGEAPDDEPDDEDDDEPPEGAPPAQPTGEAPDSFTIGDGRTLSRADAERLYSFDQYMRANPDKAAAVNAALASTTPPTVGGQPPVPTPPAPASETPEWKEPEPPDYLDLEDPSQKFTWESHVATQKALFDRDQRDNQLFAQQAQERQANTVRQAQQDTAAAVATFKQVHPNLNEDDIAAIRKASVPFIDGMLKNLPPVEALGRAMEVAAVMDDDLRAKIQDPTVRTRSNKEQTRHRKARLGEISGSPRSAPKTEPTRPVYTSDKDFLNALAAEFSEHMQR